VAQEWRAVVAGWAAWLLVAAFAGLLAKGFWPGYAAAAEGHRFTLAMLLVRLGVGAVATLVAGAVAAWFAGGRWRAVLLTGGGLLLLSLVRHYQIWDQYPVWYHIVYLGYLLPLTVLGGHCCPPRCD
jgi:hypothetical protein